MTPDNESQNETPNMPVGGVENTKQKSTKTEKGDVVLHDIDISTVDKYIKDHNLNPNEVEHWTSKAEDLLRQHGTDFLGFIEENQDLVMEGDEMLRDVKTTGFNIDRFYFFLDKKFLERSGSIAIYYNNGINRPEHFGLLIAGLMQSDGKNLLKNAGVELSCKATRVLWNWDGTNPSDEKIVTRSDGSKRRVGETIETVAKFSFKNDKIDDIRAVLNYLRANTFLLNSVPIPGSWEIPDIRISPDLFGLGLKEQELPGFISVINNLRNSGSGRLMVLRGSTQFSAQNEEWDSNPITVNEEMHQFIVGDGIEE